MAAPGTRAADGPDRTRQAQRAAFFRLQIEDTVVNGMDYALLDVDGKVAEVTTFGPSRFDAFGLPPVLEMR